MAFSRPQQGKYRQLVDDAYANERARLVNQVPPKDDWRRQINLNATGKYSTKEMNSTGDFDAVMLELAILAEDDYWIGRLSSAAERRIRWIISKQFLPDLQYLKQQSIHWSYIKGICEHMHVPTELDDCPAQLLIKVLQAVDSHVRRLARKAGIELADLPSGYFRAGTKGPAAQAKFRHDHHHHITHKEDAA
jgi:hypothetical protein